MPVLVRRYHLSEHAEDAKQKAVAKKEELVASVVKKEVRIRTPRRPAGRTSMRTPRAAPPPADAAGAAALLTQADREAKKIFLAIDSTKRERVIFAQFHTWWVQLTPARVVLLPTPPPSHSSGCFDRKGESVQQLNRTRPRWVTQKLAEAKEGAPACNAHRSYSGWPRRLHVLLCCPRMRSVRPLSASLAVFGRAAEAKEPAKGAEPPRAADAEPAEGDGAAAAAVPAAAVVAVDPGPTAEMVEQAKAEWAKLDPGTCRTPRWDRRPIAVLAVAIGRSVDCGGPAGGAVAGEDRE